LIVKENNDTFLDLAMLQSKLTPAKAIAESQPLAIFKKGREREVSKGITNLIWAIQRSLNLSQKMDDTQSMEAAISIADEFSDLTLEEIILCFKEAKMGKYGKVYNRIDVQIISEWLQQYRASEERLTYLENRHKQNNTKEDLFANVTDEEALKQLKAIRDNLSRPAAPKIISIKEKLAEVVMTEEQAINEFEAIKDKLNADGLDDYKEFFIKARFQKALSICYQELIRRKNGSK